MSKPSIETTFRNGLMLGSVVVADLEHSETDQSALAVAMQDVPLINYDTARRALAEAVRIDEVRAIHDQAMALKACAKIARDQQMELDAAEIRVRAERRLGEIMKEQAKTVGKAKGGDKGGKRPKAGLRKNPANAPPTLTEAGIDKNLAHRGRKAAKLSTKEFENEVAEMRKGNRGTLDIRRAAKPGKRTVVRGVDADRQATEVVDQAQGLQRSDQASFVSRADSAGAGAYCDDPLQPGQATKFAILARNVAEKWAALADRFEQADRDNREQAIARLGNDEHERG